MLLRNRPSFAWITLGLALASIVVSTPRADAQFTFNLTSDSITSGIAAYQSFQAAADRWASLFSDNMTVNLNIEYQSLGDDILGYTQANYGFGVDDNRITVYSYSAVRNALSADKASVADTSSVASLSTGSSIQRLINHTSENGNASSIFLNSVSQLYMTTANAKAMGLLAGNNGALDARIVFNSDFGSSYAFNPANVGATQIDFTGIATHEIGHALGFVSAVDDLNYDPGFAARSYQLNPLDLFRYSQTSTTGAYATNHVLDFAADERLKYFSVDGGKTLGPQFATGEVYGDGDQASHWKAMELNNGQTIGIMDPYGRDGQVLTISQNDVTALDVIGYNVRVAAVPEPSLCVAFGLGLIGLGGTWARQRRQRKKTSVSGAEENAAAV